MENAASLFPLLSRLFSIHAARDPALILMAMNRNVALAYLPLASHRRHAHIADIQVVPPVERKLLWNR
jgi:hypothetical protein